MKLADLNPKWLEHGGEGVSRRNPHTGDYEPIPLVEKVGMSFDCPCGCHHALTVLFKVPVGRTEPYHMEGIVQWDRTGDTFEDITLTPSILRSSGCGWHGFITKGEIIPC